MLIACWSPKGGCGTTVVSCGLALVLARDPGHRAAGGVLLADLAGDVPAVVGVAEPTGPGLADWLEASDDVPPDALGRLAIDVAPGLSLLPSGTSHLRRAGSGRGDALAAALAAVPYPVVVDCGGQRDGGPDRSERNCDVGLAVAAAASVSLMVLRPCYLALRRALAAPIRPTGVILVTEPGRSLSRRDVEDVLGVPVRAQVEYDPAVARAVDAGLLARRAPRAFQRALERAA